MTSKPVQINVGCGATPTRNWLNIDNSPVCWLRYAPWAARLLARRAPAGPRAKFLSAVSTGEIVKGDALCLRVGDQSASIVYSSHFIPRLRPGQFRLFLRETLRVLIPGGYLRIAFRDDRKLADAYVRRQMNANEFCRQTLLVPNVDGLLQRIQFLMLGHRGSQWLYDVESVSSLLIEMGFEDVAVLPPGVTGAPDCQELNLRERVENSVYIECRKPRV